MKPEQLLEMRKLVEAKSAFWDEFARRYEDELRQQDREVAKADAAEAGVRYKERESEDWEPSEEFRNDIELLEKTIKDKLDEANTAMHDVLGNAIKVVFPQLQVIRYLKHQTPDSLVENIVMPITEASWDVTKKLIGR